MPYTQNDHKQRQAEAKESLRQGWLLASSVGQMTDEEIEREIDEARAALRLRNPNHSL